MNGRKRAYQKGLSALRASRNGTGLTRKRGRICAIAPRLYNADGMRQPNQIIAGDSIKLLNEGPSEWVDLVFADPPFNIGYLYHGYNDKQNADDYLKFSEDWMRAAHRSLKPTG